MKARPIAILLLLIVILAAAFWGGILAHNRSEVAKAENHAIWIARTWSEGASMDDVCRQAAEAGKIPILRDEWDAGSGDDIALGPVVSGKRACVRRDRSIYWKAAK